MYTVLGFMGLVMWDKKKKLQKVQNGAKEIMEATWNDIIAQEKKISCKVFWILHVHMDMSLVILNMASTLVIIPTEQLQQQDL